MKSISQFWSDKATYRAIVSSNGRFVIKHSYYENYQGYNEIFLLYDSGKLIREIIGENCLFINNDYILKFPFWGYSEECRDFNLINLNDNSLVTIPYSDDIESCLVARTAVFNSADNNVYYFSNVQSAIKDYTKFLYSIDVSKLIKSKTLKVCETNLNFIPDNTFLEIYKESLLCFDENQKLIQLKLPINRKNEIIAYHHSNVDFSEIEYIDRFIALDIHTISSKMNADGSFITNRTYIGDLLYRFKYKNEINLVDEISKYVSNRIINEFGAYSIDIIIPVPASNINREYQPVEEIVKCVSKEVDISCDLAYIKKSKKPVEIKSINNNKERSMYLDNLYIVPDNRYLGKNVLIVDDLVRSGSTLMALAKTLKELGKVDRVYGLSITKTRTKR